jgi:GMP synthase-like glutamine amidotransferase
MSRALVLRHHREDRPGLVGDALEQRGFTLDVTMMNASTPPLSVEPYDVIVVLGSTSSVYDEDIQRSWFHRELAVLGDAQRCSVPVLGLCFGAQALCRFYGGTVEKGRESEFGWYEIDVSDGVALPRGPWFEYHSDICVVPPVAEVWATTPRAVQAFAIDRNIGVQFHPEIDEAQLREWFNSDDGARDFGVDLDDLLERTAQETPSARERAATLVDLFLRRAS